MQRKLSEIIIEIAMLGLKDTKYSKSEVMHPLFFLAHIAWNRDTKSSDYLPEEEYLSHLSKFPISKRKKQKELISQDWENILAKMIAFKKQKFPDDKRIITLLGYTPRLTLQVEWE